MSGETEKMPSGRIEIIDGIRGLAVVLMVIHHFLYDLVAFLGAPEALFTNPVFDVLHYVFAGVFICLCGVSSRFSRSNIKRGIKTGAAALLITAVTAFMDMPVLFGVLHLLAFCMLFYGLTYKLWEKFPQWLMPVFCVAFTVLSALGVELIEIESRGLWIFGWTYEGFMSFDYFPLFPWIFVFLFGTWLGKIIKDGRLPLWFYTLKPPLFPKNGRQAFIIYLLHQPVLYGVTMLIGLLMGK